MEKEIEEEIVHIEEEDSVHEINLEDLNEKFDVIMKKFETLNIDREIGEKEKKRDTRVIIDKIELENFKSYAGAKKIGPLNFSFNSVVGPNGSGKSNLMESLLFVFGKRAKKMRLSKLSELIHHSTTQKSLRFARVSIFFKEITEKYDQSGKIYYEEVPDSDFILSREVYKNSSSKYFFNKKEISFDLLHEFLSKKDIDLKHNRFLILQGEVEQIAMMRPKATSSSDIGILEFLEDIIGTNRYVKLIEKLTKDIEDLGEIKLQKLNRLKIAKTDLDKLEDVKNASVEYYKLEKLSLILNNLNKQIFKYYYEQLIENWNKKILSIEEKINSCENEISENIQRNKYVLEQHTLIKSQQELYIRKRDQLNKEVEEYDEIDKEKRAESQNLVKQINKLKTSLESFNRLYSQQNEEIQVSSTNLPNKERELLNAKEIKIQIEQYIDEKEDLIYKETKKLLEEKQNILNCLEPFQRKMDQTNNEIEVCKSKIKYAEGNTISLENDLANLNLRKGEIELDIKKKNDLIVDLEEKVQKISEEIKEKKQKSSNLKSELHNHLQKLEEIENKNHELKQLNQERYQKNNILESLIKAQNDGLLTGIYGRLGDLGMIDNKYDVAITTACSALDNIVVDSIEIGQNCVEYLRKNHLGRATFICLDKISYLEEKVKKLASEFPPQNSERLFDLIKVKNVKFLNAFYFAIKDTLVTGDLKTATSLAYGSIRRRVVTLDGSLIEISGVMSGGGKPKRGGMSRVSEDFSPEVISKINNELELIKKTIVILKKEKEQNDDLVQRLHKECNELNLIKKKIEFELLTLDKSLIDNNKRIKLIEKNIEKFKNDKDMIPLLKESILEKENIVKEIEEEARNLNLKIESLDKDIEKAGGIDLQKKKEELKRTKKKIDELEKEVFMMKSTVEKAGEMLNKTKKEIEGREKHIKELEEKIKKVNQDLKEIEENALNVYQSIEECNKKTEELNKQFDEKRKEVEELKILIKKNKEEQEKLRNEIKESKSEKLKLKKNISTTIDEITSNKASYLKLIEEFGFIDNIEEDIKSIIHRTNNNNQDEEKDIFIDNNNNLEEEQNKLVSSKPGKKKKAANKDYQKFKDTKYLENDFPQEEIEELSKYKDEIMFESIQVSEELNNKDHDMEAIKLYKKKLEDLHFRDQDYNMTTEKLFKCKKVFELVKKKRFDEFMEGFTIISTKLKELYQLITHGGDAELELLDSLDPFSEGINYSVRPFKKSWKQISNLSGGEKTLASLSLIFALHHYKPSPLYVMDEIDAALDFKNVSIIANYIKEQTKNSQFIVISLRNHMFESADRLVGIYKTNDITKCITYDPDLIEEANTKNKKDKEANQIEPTVEKQLERVVNPSFEEKSEIVYPSQLINEEINLKTEEAKEIDIVIQPEESNLIRNDAIEEEKETIEKSEIKLRSNLNEEEVSEEVIKENSEEKEIVKNKKHNEDEIVDEDIPQNTIIDLT